MAGQPVRVDIRSQAFRGCLRSRFRLSVCHEAELCRTVCGIHLGFILILHSGCTTQTSHDAQRHSRSDRDCHIRCLLAPEQLLHEVLCQFRAINSAGSTLRRCRVPTMKRLASSVTQRSEKLEMSKKALVCSHQSWFNTHPPLGESSAA